MSLFFKIICLYVEMLMSLCFNSKCWTGFDSFDTWKIRSHKLISFHPSNRKTEFFFFLFECQKITWALISLKWHWTDDRQLTDWLIQQMIKMWQIMIGSWKKESTNNTAWKEEWYHYKILLHSVFDRSLSWPHYLQNTVGLIKSHRSLSELFFQANYILIVL